LLKSLFPGLIFQSLGIFDTLFLEKQALYSKISEKMKNEDHGHTIDPPVQDRQTEKQCLVSHQIQSGIGLPLYVIHGIVSPAHDL
jgi:hypothetical protein